MYNKAQYRVASNKKLLRKKGNKWITVSVAMLGLLGVGTVAYSQPIHASARPSTVRTVHTKRNKIHRKANLRTRINRNVRSTRGATKRTRNNAKRINSHETIQHDANQLAQASHFSFNSPKERRQDANLVKAGERNGLISNKTMKHNPATIKLESMNTNGLFGRSNHAKKATRKKGVGNNVLRNRINRSVTSIKHSPKKNSGASVLRNRINRSITSAKASPKRASNAKNALPTIRFSSITDSSTQSSRASKAPSIVSSATNKTFNTFNTYNLGSQSMPSATPIQDTATNFHQSLVNRSVQQNLNVTPSSATAKSNVSQSTTSQSTAPQSSTVHSASAPSKSNAKPSANVHANANNENTWPGNVYTGDQGVQNNVHSDALFNVPSDVAGHTQIGTIAPGTHNVSQRYDTGNRHMTKRGTSGNVTPKILGNPGRYESNLPVGANDGAGSVIHNQGDTFAKNDNALNLWVPNHTRNNQWDLAGIPQSNGSYFVASGYSQYFDYNKPTAPQYSDIYSTRQVPVNNTANISYNKVYHSTHGQNYGYVQDNNGWINLGSTNAPSGNWKVQNATDPINYNYGSQNVGKTVQSGKPNTTANLNLSNMPAGWNASANAPKTVTFNNQAVNIPVSPLQQTDTINYMNVSDGKIGTQKMTGNDSRATQAGNNSFTLSAKPSGLDPMYKVVTPGQNFVYNGSTHNVNVGIDTDYIQNEINDAKATHSVAPQSNNNASATSASASSSAPASSSADMNTTMASLTNNYNSAINAQKAETQSLENLRNSLEADVNNAGVVITPTNANVSPNANRTRKVRKHDRKARKGQPAYLDVMKPVLVHNNPQSVGAYKDFFGRITPHHTVRTFGVKHVGRPTRFTVHYNHKSGYITGNTRFVRYTYYQKKEVGHHDLIRALTKTSVHTGSHFGRRNFVRNVKAGTILRIKGVHTIAKGKMTRFQLTNGHWITSNKSLVKIV